MTQQKIAIAFPVHVEDRADLVDAEGRWISSIDREKHSSDEDRALADFIACAMNAAAPAGPADCE